MSESRCMEALVQSGNAKTIEQCDGGGGSDSVTRNDSQVHDEKLSRKQAIRFLSFPRLGKD